MKRKIVLRDWESGDGGQIVVMPSGPNTPISHPPGRRYPGGVLLELRGTFEASIVAVGIVLLGGYLVHVEMTFAVHAGQRKPLLRNIG